MMQKIWLSGTVGVGAFLAIFALHPESLVDVRPEAPEPERTPLSATGDSPSPGAQSQGPSDQRLIGVPFPVSASVEATCARPHALCGRQRLALQALSREPRDEAWARRMTARIEQEVLAERPGTYALRRIDCRTSLCAAEIESRENPYLGAANALLAEDLADRLMITGEPEIDASGQTLRVTLAIFD